MGRSGIVLSGRILGGLLCGAVGWSAMSPAWAEGAEHLQFAPPQDFKALAQEHKGGKWVPAGESGDTWTRRISTQIYDGYVSEKFYPDYRAYIAKLSKEDCADSDSTTIHEGVIDGLQNHVWIQVCRSKDQAEPPKYDFIRFIQGHDGAYIVIEEMKYKPSDSQVEQVTDLLSSAKVVSDAGSDAASGNPYAKKPEAKAATASKDDYAGELLLQSIPTGFKIGDHGKTAAGVELTEMVPKNETVDDWTQMVTTQVYFGVTNFSIEQAKANMAKIFKDNCDHTDTTVIRDGNENGYPFHVWMQTCEHDDMKQKPEITWFKYIKGKDSTYVVQRAFHNEPSKEQVVDAVKYLASVQVCDTRSKDSPCPGTQPAK